ncbi:hypothetical protein CJD36_021930 [Flavipsychrobacter stenotrophus]|uniref:Uncharacterized protein n=1 Tax=Flavipsychrobacter stenotrophus TaxID=2077091 RepID=A0A2S7SQT4_9BACT|nr:hypothetical protein [Flavipsychrobacter stenotrophus]PQJ08926.1 hypothetical protein CJD36_021930 [Flavipsychrobacter stenotrophus]
MTPEQRRQYDEIQKLPFHKKTATSPKTTNNHIEKLLNQLNVEFDPEIIPVRVEPEAKTKSCYYNVEEKMKRDGGKIHYGWAIWQSQYLCEAEHHSVWEDNEGELVCVTPREQRYDKIMFVPDNNRVYKGVSISNVALNISGNPLIDDFIKIRYAICKLYEYGERKDVEVVVLPKCANDAITECDITSGAIEVFYLLGNKPTSNCYCRSLKPYRQCHGKDIDKKLQYCLSKVKQTIEEHTR